ncbi:beta-D-hydroxybutyrate dehydrogenase [Caldovatus sediminis]|uniref:Beta-D-hydroxybutyrate dehydrogenase n=1 Tax=Caldovatus sediminis TaxID=2041189 RepID=A0A8J2ZEN2_9PROT|nr:SDR family NAD(P)-dependent oxidoreductase [Caldovatus sediminis]GGG48570.1 beta-D-hydroxybutyrate dehydrogenase [Caldovatus sediminis]
MSPPPLKGRRALVTGSTGGLGLAIAARLAAEGCGVMLHGLADPEEAEPARRALAERHGAPVLYCRADLADRTEIEALVCATERGLGGGVDILVNNAVTRHFGPVDALAPADWDADIAVNLTAAFHAIRLTLPGMRARGWGRILNMSSVYGLIGAAGRAGYVTTKTALIGLTRAVALETAREDITCNALCPGSTLTPAIETRLAPQLAAAGDDPAARAAVEAAFLADRQPSRRFIAADRVAAMAAFLCGPAGADITGAAIPIDGGWSAS